uniref:NADPH-dependent diflavin oxidoreductase 1 n=1 Tax=Tetradesmus obliquus TaxID=3088 RepID=A0A383VDI1_TETOB|eukprot:jgi/Sobl393_1/12465/SZX63000.1
MQEVDKTRLLILYGSQTGNAQDVAERVAREARLLLFAPSIMPMDAYPLQHLPDEKLVALVTATTGQGDPPDNMRKFWRMLLRKNLPGDLLAGLQYAVFGLGDSGYVKFNVAAKKLDRRLAALGAEPLLERGLGDDQHPSGYEASLDPWLQQLWAVLRQRCPLPPGVQQPVLDEAALLQLGPPKYKVTQLPGGPQQPANIARQQQQQQQLQAAAGNPAAAKQLREQHLIEQAVAAAAAFRAVAAEAAGMATAAAANGTAQGQQQQQQQQQQQYGPWQPFMAPLLINQRVTAADHFQDTRHIEFDLQGSGFDYQPGDLLAVFPRTPAADVEAALLRLGLDGDAWLRVEPAEQQQQQQQQQQQDNGTQHANGSSSAAGAVCEATARAIVQGVLDLSNCSPRRYLFQVLSHFASNAMQQERLQYFATAEGRDDLYRYNQRERRSLLEVLQDFSSAAPPLERLLEAAPLLSPRQFSLTSSPAAHPGRAAILVAVVAWATPTKRLRKGLLTSWLAGLAPAAAAAAADGGVSISSQNGTISSSSSGVSVPIRVPVWVERGALRLPPSHSTPLLLVGPGTGVAPFRSFIWHRAAIKQHQQQQQQQLGSEVVPQQQVADSSCLFFGCRSPSADFYYRQEWGQLMQQQALQQQHGLIVAFSRHSPQLDQQQLLDMLQQQQQQQPGNAAASSAADGAGAATEQAAAAAAAAVAAAEVRPPGSRVYVTHKLREQGAMVWQLLQQGAWVYVSGSAEKMPAAVVSALEDVAQQHGGLTREAAAKYIRQLELSGRYHVEAWS